MDPAPPSIGLAFTVTAFVSRDPCPSNYVQ